jgi:hypothetical protein
MQQRGYELTVTRTPADFEELRGQMSTACFSRQDEIFQASRTDENLAVCEAALRAYGLAFSNDE